eukprot:GHVN01034513.1.p3 GENE.GHVN01034513.1~~GHVN01034513.1.p3  ORF type:complete len:213 (-),score=29.66 GHVN01034513.1:894-1532(-)
MLTQFFWLQVRRFAATSNPSQSRTLSKTWIQQRKVGEGTVYKMHFDPPSTTLSLLPDVQKTNEEVMEALKRQFDVFGDSIRSCCGETTPAESFFKVNSASLAEKTAAYYQKRKVELQEAANAQEEEDWMWELHSDPVVVPPRGHVWQANPSRAQREPVQLRYGQLPSLEEVIAFLEQESISNCATIDMGAKGRSDVARYGIVGTSPTAALCK